MAVVKANALWPVATFGWPAAAGGRGRGGIYRGGFCRRRFACPGARNFLRPITHPRLDGPCLAAALADVTP